jgi:hypothetical protein
MPPIAPATITGTKNQPPVAAVACIATPLAKIAPTMNWPSAPMFQTF